MNKKFLLLLIVLSSNSATVFADGRLLASQCFQCHGPNGHSKGGIDSIAGESESEIYNELKEMKQKNKIEIMHLQAKSYTDAEIREIAQYLSTLR